MPDQSLYLTTIASSIANIIARLVLHPIETLKAKIQVEKRNLQSGSLKRIFQFTLQKQGFKGFYQGLGIAIIGTTPGFITYMTTYTKTKQELNKFQRYPGFNHLLSGLNAEIVACFFFLPVDVQKNLNIYSYKNSLDAAKVIIKNEGIIGLYRAYGATIAFFGPFSALYFFFYQKLKFTLLQNHKHPSFYQSLLCAGTAGSLAGWITNPLDVVKLRMQVQRAQKSVGKSMDSFRYKNIIHGLYKIITQQGSLALFRGSMIRIMFSAPMTAISMSLTESIKQMLNKNN